ncbi:MAG: hypothetical protein ABWW65_05995 [Thermoprotei archaeon]
MSSSVFIYDSANNSANPFLSSILELVVDGLVVKASVIASFREGVLAYWPPDIDNEIVWLAENIYIPSIKVGYTIINSPSLKYKYLLIQFQEKILLLALDKRVDGEELGEKISRVFERAMYKRFL